MKRARIELLGVFLIIIGGIILALPRTAFVGEDPILRTQGIINPGGNLKAGYLLINEMRIYLDSSTQILNHRGGTVPATELKPKKWVYLEIEKSSNTLKARKIYLLPRYVGPERKKDYPFMK